MQDDGSGGYRKHLFHNRLFLNVARRQIDSKITALKEVVGNILAGAKSLFSDSDWLSSESKAYLIRKVTKMNVVYGYPTWIMNDALLDKFYVTKLITSRHTSNNSYFANLRAILRWDFSDLLLFNKAERRMSFVHSSGGLPLHTTNAVYFRNTNWFEIFAGLLSDLLFQADSPPAVKYGMVGVVIGHEIFHGFDPNGKSTT